MKKVDINRELKRFNDFWDAFVLELIKPLAIASIPKANIAAQSHFKAGIAVMMPPRLASMPDMANESKMRISAMIARRCCDHLTIWSNCGSPL